MNVESANTVGGGKQVAGKHWARADMAADEAEAAMKHNGG